jgi:TatD DNase family protein
MWKYIDIHSHINFPEYDADREALITRMKEAGVATITVGTSLETSRSAVALADQYDNIFACVGIHPAESTMTDIVNSNQHSFDQLAFEELIMHPKVVAVGECGLDYGRDGVVTEESKARQIALFEQQIEFAVKHDKPIMIHARSSNTDIIEILKNKKAIHGAQLRGNAHFFSGTKEQADAYGSLDFSVSFTGVLTFTHDYDEVVRHVPLENMMSETDSPFVSPVPYRGKRNEPTWVIEVAKKIAEIKGLDEQETYKVLLKNAVAKFKIV